MTIHTLMKVDKATFYRIVQSDPDGRYEYVRGRVMQQMAGGTFLHAQISKRMLAALDSRIDKSVLVSSGPDRGVDTSVTIRYPDVSVEPVGPDPKSLATTKPVVIVEVLSQHSEDRDMFVKPEEYLALRSLQAYVIVSQDEPALFVYQRDADGGFANEPDLLRGEEQTLVIPTLSLSIPLSEIYRGLFEPPASGTPETAKQS